MKMQDALNAIFLSLAVVSIFVLDGEHAWILLGMGAAHLLACSREYRLAMLLSYSAITMLGLVGMHTDLGPLNIMLMGGTLCLAVAAPYLVSGRIYQCNWITFPVEVRGIWNMRRILYIFLGMFIAWLLIPFYLEHTEAWRNWSFEPTFRDMGLLLLGMLVVGAWDELFFVNTIMRLFRVRFSFWIANLLQAVIFASLLFELGFTGWGFYMIFLFALIQGCIYRRTQSLVYLITVHLCIDSVLWAAMVNAHYPEKLAFFLT